MIQNNAGGKNYQVHEGSGSVNYIGENHIYVTGQPPNGLDDIDWSDYLESIRTRYEKWWERYTPTDAIAPSQKQETEQSSPFDFGLTVETLPSATMAAGSGADSSQANQSKTEQFPVLDGLKKYAEKHVLLEGRPGSGKSTALVRFALEEAQNTNKIPVLVELRYWQDSLESLILDALAQHGCHMERDRLGTVLSQAILLFDGVNELPSEKARLQLGHFRRIHPNVPMVFTTRDLSLGGDLGVGQKLKMQPLTTPQMEAFIHAHIPQHAEPMVQQLKDRLRELSETPLMLWMLCEVFRQAPDQQLPTNLAGIFQTFTNAYEASSVRKHEVASLKGDVRPLSDRRLWKTALKTLAAAMMQGEFPVDYRVVMHRDEAEHELSKLFPNENFPIRSLLDDLLKYHLLQNRSTDQIEFHHQFIQDYYAAEHLSGLLSSMTDTELKENYLNYLKWTEPISLMLALQNEEDKALRVVRLALNDVDLMLGARLAGEVQPEIQFATIGWVKNLEIPTEIKCKLWELSRSEKAIPDLLKIIRDSNSNCREDAVYALNSIGSESAFYILIDCLEDLDSEFRRTVKLQLSNISNISLFVKILNEIEISSILQEIVIHLLKENKCHHIQLPCFELGLIFYHTNSSARRDVADYIGEIGSEDASSRLIELLEDTDRSVRKHSALALGKLGFEEAIPILLSELLKCEYDFERRDLVDTLDKVCSSSAVPLLVNALDSTKYEFKKCIVNILRKHVGNVKTSILIESLKGQKTSVIWDVAEISYEIGYLKVIPEMHKILHSSKFQIRWIATIFLARFENKCAIPELLNALESSDPEVRRFAIYSLAKFKDIDVTDILLNALDDQDYWFCREVAFALGEVGNMAATSVLCKILEDTDRDSDIRSLAAEALAQPCNKAVVPQLIHALYDSDRDIRSWVAFALYCIKSKASIPGLMNALNESDDLVRLYISLALGELGCDAAIPNLINFLKDEDFGDFCEGIIEALVKFGPEVSTFALTTALQYQDDGIREYVVEKIKAIGDESIISELAKLLDHPETCVRAGAAHSLWNLGERFGNKVAVPGLLTLFNDPDDLLQLHAVISMRYFDHEIVIPKLFEALDATDAFELPECASYVLEEIGQPSILSVLWQSQLERPQYYKEVVIQSIQNRCQYYNYEIYQQVIQKDRGINPNNQLVKIQPTTYNTKQLTGSMTNQPHISISGGTFNGTVNLASNQGNQPTTIIGTQNNYFGVDEGLLQQIADLQEFIAELESEHPNLQTTDEANQVVDGALVEIQTQQPERLQKLRQQMTILKHQILNPERHLQAAKASAVELTKKAWEKSLIATAIITYLDKLSEDPNHGA